MAVTTCPSNGKRPVGLKLLQTSYKTCIHLTTLCIDQLYNKLSGTETTFANFVIVSTSPKINRPKGATRRGRSIRLPLRFCD